MKIGRVLFLRTMLNLAESMLAIANDNHVLVSINPSGLTIRNKKRGNRTQSLPSPSCQARQFVSKKRENKEIQPNNACTPSLGKQQPERPKFINNTLKEKFSP